MSHYIQRWCQRHGDWDEDVDSPSGCPECEKDAKHMIPREEAPRQQLTAPDSEWPAAVDKAVDAAIDAALPSAPKE